MTLANHLTMLRVWLTLPILWLLTQSFTNAHRWACLLFIFAALTDAIDGWVARRYNLVSRAGKLLDPLADKLLVVGVLLVLNYQHRLGLIVVMLLIGRELAVSSLRGLANEEGVIIAASQLGKLKTVFQFLALIALILGPNESLWQIPWQVMGERLIWIATCLSLLSAMQYFQQHRRRKPPA